MHIPFHDLTTLRISMLESNDTLLDATKFDMKNKCKYRPTMIEKMGKRKGSLTCHY